MRQFRSYGRALVKFLFFDIAFATLFIMSMPSSIDILVLAQPNKHFVDYFLENILFVSMYFPLPKSKYNQSKYEEWLPFFLNLIKSPLYFITTNKMKIFLENTTGSHSNIVYNLNYQSPFDLPRISNYKDLYEKMHKIDKEREIHNPYLYAVWNGKVTAMKLAVTRYPHFRYYFWIDCGSLREHELYENITFPRPDLADVLDTYTDPPLELLFGMTYRINNTIFDIMDNMIEAGIIGGTRKGMLKFYDTYFKFHDSLAKKGVMVGKEQNLFNYMFLSKKTNISMYVMRLHTSRGRCIRWFAFYSLLSSENTCDVDTVLYRRMNFKIKMKVNYLNRRKGRRRK